MFLKRSTSSMSSSSGSILKRTPAPSKFKFQVQRAPIMPGLHVVLNKKFQRPSQKRRAYGKQADEALKQSSLGARRRMNGMAKLFARAGKGLTYKLPQTAKLHSNGTDDESDSEAEDEEKEAERPFEPLCLWQSPHQDGIEAKGLPGQVMQVTQSDEYGIEETVQRLCPAPIQAYSKQNVFVPPILAKWLRPHQREGVKFMYECVMGLKDFDGNGCILADDMGLGKTLQSVTLIYTLLKTHITSKPQPTCKRVIVICPCSLVKNWDNEFVKWLGPGGVKTLALAEADRKKVEKDIDTFVKTNMFNILIASYECIRTHVNRLKKCPTGTSCCDLLVCDEAHRLKNSDNQTSRALNSIPCKRRVLLTGTPMQNDLQEFFAMVDFTNAGVLGTIEEFRKRTLFPILRGREPDATDSQKAKMLEIQNNMSQTVNDFILRRVNTLNAEHLPPKLVQVVCCNLTDIQQNMYQHLVNSKDMQHVLDGKQVNCLSSIQMLMKLCNHPSLIVEEDNKGPVSKSKRVTKTVKYNEDEKESTAAPGADGVSKYLPPVGTCGRGGSAPVLPEWSGKMFVLYRLMKEMRKPGNGGDKIVIVSNYTQTLDLIGRMCRESNWGFCRLDGSISMKKRQKMVDEFNDPSSGLIAFLLSSKAGGCGLNLIGGNRLVLFDPDWNPAVDKQAAARCWRDGQKKRCFTYRFLATGTVEEKIFQRQLSKEGLQSVVDDKEQVNTLSTKDLRNLFKLRTGTPSDTHDKLRCDRCKIIHDHAEMEAVKILPKKLEACKELLNRMEKEEDAKYFVKVLDPTEHDCTKEVYEGLVKQPMDFGTICASLAKPQDQPGAYKSVSSFSKDVNRVFANVLKVWDTGTDIADAARRMQGWWSDQWRELVPKLMLMKASDDEQPGPSSDACIESDPLAASAAFHNERDEDFQPQLGMPDEENMRSWSHHYSTDSVDDPIFRAAMRGCDSVSFVFGLEVTWSKIQERQQEEEERQREEEELAALEACKELGEEGESSDESDTENRKPAASVQESPPKADIEEEKKMEDEDNVSSSIQEDIPAKPKAASTEPIFDTDDEDDATLQTSTFTESAKVSKEVESEPPVAKKPKCSVDVFADTSDEDEPTEVSKEFESEPAAKKPTRSVDVFADSSDEEEKEEEKVQTKPILENTSEEEPQKLEPAPEEVPTQAAAAASNTKEWACSQCTLLNPLKLKKCSACGGKAPPQKRGKPSNKKRSVLEIS